MKDIVVGAITCSDVRTDRKRAFERMCDEVKPDFVYRDDCSSGSSFQPWMKTLRYLVEKKAGRLIALVPDDLYLPDPGTDPRDVVRYMVETAAYDSMFFEPRNAHHAHMNFDQFSAPDSFTGFFGTARVDVWRAFLDFSDDAGNHRLQFDELVNAFMMCAGTRCQHTSKSYVLHDNSVESADGNGHQDRENPGGIERVGKNPAKPGDLDRIGPVVEKLGRQYASNHHRFFWAMRDNIIPSRLYEVERCR